MSKLCRNRNKEQLLVYVRRVRLGIHLTEAGSDRIMSVCFQDAVGRGFCELPESFETGKGPYLPVDRTDNAMDGIRVTAVQLDLQSATGDRAA